MKNRIALLRALALCLVFPTLTEAIPIAGSPTGLPSPDTTITFSEVVLANGTAVTNQYSGFGVTFSGVFYNPNPGGTYPNGSKPDVGNFPPNTNPFSIMFNQAVMDAAFAMITNPGTSLFQAYLGGTLVESFSAPTTFNSSNNFYGFTGSLFDEIRVTAGGDGGAALFDNLQFNLAPPTSVPEPGSTVMLLGLSLVGLGFLRRILTLS